MKILLLNKLYFPHISGIEKVVENLVFPIPLWFANKIDKVLDTSYIKERYGDKIILFVGRFVYYQAADIFVLPSIYKSEAYGLVLLEAMYYNTPIITFDLPTGVSFVNDGKTMGQ